MKKNSKKRVLLSSVAMLMVGAVSLGTATYAWFTQNTRSYADQISVKTTKVSSLVLSKKDKTNWQSHIQYGVGTEAAPKVMYPASGNGAAWVYGSASDATTGKIDTTTLKSATATGTTTEDYVFIDMLNIKNAGATAVKDIKITFDLAGDNSDYARVALVPVADAQNDKVKTADGTFGSTTVYGKDANEAYKPIVAVAGTEGDSITPTTTYEVAVPNLAVGEMAYYNLYVWFEGQDPDCIDANSGQEIPNLVFDVAGSPVTE